MKKITFAAAVLVAAFLFSCSSSGNEGPEISSSSYQSSPYQSSSSVWNGETFTDPRDPRGKAYKIVNYDDNNIWFAERLDIDMQTWYTHEEAMVACPIGWRIPSLEEFNNIGLILMLKEEIKNFTDLIWWTFSEETFFGIKFNETAGYTRRWGDSYSVLCKECSSSNNCYYGAVYGDDLIDDRDSQNPQTYKTVIIGTQTWMARNLNYNVPDSRCYNDSIAYCDKYGRLYSWATAMNLASSCNSNKCSSQIQSKHRGICPNGWHLPNRYEWGTLVDYAMRPLQTYGSTGKILKANNCCWPNSGDHYYYWRDRNIDYYGFSALPGGYFSDGRFDLVNPSGYWWTTSEFGADYIDAYKYYMSDVSGEATFFAAFKSDLLSVRCVKDE